jgi:hypothetical protein
MAESSTSDDDVPVIKKTQKSQNSTSEANGVKVVYGGSKDPDDPSSDDEDVHARISKAPPQSLKTRSLIIYASYPTIYFNITS